MISLGFSETVFFCRAETKTTLVQKKGREKVMEQHITISVQKKKQFFSNPDDAWSFPIAGYKFSRQTFSIPRSQL